MYMPVFTPPAPAAGTARDVLATLLQGASRVLARAALALSARCDHATGAPGTAVFEFHAEAGAPEGALFADGRLVALLPGVQRL